MYAMLDQKFSFRGEWMGEGVGEVMMNADNRK